MKKPLLRLLAAGTLLAICPSVAALAQKAKPATKASLAANATPVAAASKPLAALFETYWEEQAKLNPFSATAQGDNRYNDQLSNDQARAFRQQQQRFYQQYQASLLKFDRSKLPAEDQVSYDVFRYQLETLEWRARYQKQLGSRFSLRAFHDELLAGGAMPLAVAERRMDA